MVRATPAPATPSEDQETINEYEDSTYKPTDTDAPSLDTPTSPSGGDGGGTGAPTVKPPKGDGNGGDKKVPYIVQQGTSAYFDIWGVMPPPGYIEGLVSQGMNYYEIIDHEKNKPAYSRTHNYGDENADYASKLASLLGLR